MFLIEKAVNLTRKAKEHAVSAIIGDDSFTVYIVNGCDETVSLSGAPYAVSTTCQPSFQDLAPGEVGTFRVSGSKGGGAALELVIGQEALFVGCAFQTARTAVKFAVEFRRDAKAKISTFQSGLAEVFFGADPALPDRAAGVRFAAICSRGDAGTFSAAPVDVDKDGVMLELPKSAVITIAGIAELAPADGRTDAVALLPHFALMSLDGARRTQFVDYVRGKDKGLLACALFLFELSSVMRVLGWISIADRAFTLDVLIEAFCAEGQRALGDDIVENLGRNMHFWVTNRHPAVVGHEGLPRYPEYTSIAADTVVLNSHVDAAVCLCWATALECARALSGLATDWDGFHQGFYDKDSPVKRREKLGSVDSFLGDSDLDDEATEKKDKKDNDMCDFLSAHLNAASREVSNPEMSSSSSRQPMERKQSEFVVTADIPSLIRNCVGDSARYSIFRSAALEDVKDMLSSKAAKEAVDHFCKWLPTELRQFQRPGTEDSPGVRFRSYSAELFANVDAGLVTNPEKLLSSMGEGSPAYQAMATNSKSGEFFFFSHDKCFLIKTVTAAEAKLLHNMLPAYQEHLRRFPKSLIVRYAGLFHVKVDGQRGLSRFFTIMVSAFDPACKIHYTFDVKGSLYNRKKKEGESIGKDQDWCDACRPLQLQEEVSSEVLAAHEADASFLVRFNVLDYSLLIGVHSLSPDEPRGSGYRDGGGLWAQGAKEIYFIGLIDFLIGFTLKKQAEHLVRSAQGHALDASCVHPEDYAFRQVKFLRESVFDTGGSSCGTLGMLRMSNIAGHGLPNMDFGPFDKSDPYVVATVGLQRVRTPTIRNNLDPKWTCELLIPINECHVGADLVLEMMDEDSVGALRGADDFMGNLRISIDEIMRKKSMTAEKMKLQNISKGSISFHLVFEPAQPIGSFCPPMRSSK